MTSGTQRGAAFSVFRDSTRGDQVPGSRDVMNDVRRGGPTPPTLRSFHDELMRRAMETDDRDVMANFRRLESSASDDASASGVRHGAAIAAVRGPFDDFRRGDAMGSTVDTRSRMVDAESRLDELNAEIMQLQREIDERTRNNYAQPQQSVNRIPTATDYTGVATTSRTTVRPTTSGRRYEDDETESYLSEVDSEVAIRRHRVVQDRRFSGRGRESAVSYRSSSGRTQDERMDDEANSRSSMVTLSQINSHVSGAVDDNRKFIGGERRRDSEQRSVDNYMVRGRRNVMRLEREDDRRVLSDEPGRLRVTAMEKRGGDDRDVKDRSGQRRQRRRHSHQAARGEVQPRRQSKNDHSSTSKKWLKPDKFDGSGSVETFLKMFENCAKYNGWNDVDKAAHFRWALTGTAAQLLWDMDDVDYKRMVERVQDRYGGKGIEEKYQNELRCRRRGRNEGLRELAQDVRRLMALAYPGEPVTR